MIAMANLHNLCDCVCVNGPDKVTWDTRTKQKGVSSKFANRVPFDGQCISIALSMQAMALALGRHTSMMMIMTVMTIMNGPLFSGARSHIRSHSINIYYDYRVRAPPIISWPDTKPPMLANHSAANLNRLIGHPCECS